MSTLLHGPDARRGWQLGRACNELDALVMLARWQRRWSASDRDRAASTVRKIYALGLLWRPPLDDVIAENILRRLRAILADRTGLTTDPLAFADRLDELAETIRDEVSEDDDARGQEDLEP